MKSLLRVLFFAATAQAILVEPVAAMPRLQHRVTGLVQRYDPQSGILTVTPDKLDLPSTFLVKESRTCLKRDGAKAALPEIPASGAVRIYYKTERGQRLATEVSWHTPKTRS